MDWTHFFSGMPARDYIFQTFPYERQMERAASFFDQADAVLIGGGAGLSAAAGLTYGGKRFTDHFREFIEKYGSANMPDMYAAGFYPFSTEEERWGYWSKHVLVNRIEPEALPLYRELFEMAGSKEHFVLTTNVDHQFWKAGFSDENIFATQGDYGLMQCQRGCHPKTYDGIELFKKMNEVRRDCRIPADMVPRCPVCGGPMAMNLRCDQYFVEDEHWNQAAERYGEFLEKFQKKNVVLLELGVGFNTPTIIRFPFEKMMDQNRKWTMIRLNLEEAVIPEHLSARAAAMNGDIAESIPALREACYSVSR